MNLFYAIPSDFSESSVSIHGQEAKHISRVLRFSEGDSISVTDGEGGTYQCEIETIGKERLTARIKSKEISERVLPFITLCLGLIKKRDRLEFAVEKSVELGADRIILFSGDNSERAKVRVDRIQGVALSAMKQSMGLFLPEVIITNSLKEAVKSAEPDVNIVVADEQLEPKSGPQMNKWDKFLLIVGPEGGFSNREREFLDTIKCEKYSLGERRLRAETAAIVMVDRFKNL
ncbi:MAG: 16S rRNA (uracil(1498)-N(3))-methyltransferase [Balneolaceae bacterium]|nr:16S rRNA (uracil(1498)-N(3))-methyltransferase [Balneolaceae bacterium]